MVADEPLSRHTTWRVGGPADLFLVPADREDLLTALRLLRDRKIPWIVIGAGSNLLVRDGGYRGAVIHTGSLRGVAFSTGTEVRVEGGVPLTGLIRRAAARGLGGLEALAGIPGTLGGAIAMNAGAGGQKMADSVASVTVAGAEGELALSADALGFGYRSANLPAQQVVVEARLRFLPEEPTALEETIRRRPPSSEAGPGGGRTQRRVGLQESPRGLRLAAHRPGRALRSIRRRGSGVGETRQLHRQPAAAPPPADILALIARIKDAVLQAERHRAGNGSEARRGR